MTSRIGHPCFTQNNSPNEVGQDSFSGEFNYKSTGYPADFTRRARRIWKVLQDVTQYCHVESIPRKRKLSGICHDRRSRYVTRMLTREPHGVAGQVSDDVRTHARSGWRPVLE